MRVTNSLMSKSYLRNLNTQTNRVLKYQKQLSSLKEVSKPSDDPLTVSKILDLNDKISQNSNYQGTIEDAIDWTNVQDSALDQANNSIGRIRTLIQSAANDTMTPKDREAVKNDVEGEIASFVDALNTSFSGRYVFAGDKTDGKPFELGNDFSLKYEGSEVNLSREVSPGVDVKLQTNGNDLFDISDLDIEIKEEGPPVVTREINDMSDFFDEVLKALDEGGETKHLGGALLGGMDQISDKVVSVRANVGSTFKRLESAKERNEAEKINLKSILSNKEDIDLAEKYMEFTMEMTAYQVSLKMGTKVMDTNIMNFV